MDLVHVNGALAARYGRQHPQLEQWNALIEQLVAHRSVRAYSPEPLPADTLSLLVAAAQSASTSSNLQLWSVIAVFDPERRRALAEAAGNQAHVARAPLFLVFVADLHRAAHIAELRGTAADGLVYLDTFLTAVIDASLAAQNAVVAAESLGLGTVYIGAMRNQPARVAELLALPPRTAALFGLCVGWPDPVVPTAPKLRLPQAVALHRDSYHPIEEDLPLLAAYDRDHEAQQRAARSTSAGPWTTHAAARLRSAEALHGRHRLRQALAERGFELE